MAEVTITQDTKWVRALNAARRTVGKEPKPLDYEPSDKWKRMALMAEHSPIKLVEYCISFKDLRQWVGVHLLRHEHVIPQIHTQRGDRRDIISEYPYIKEALDDIEENARQFINPRDFVRQGETNDQDFYVNAQTLINISRRIKSKSFYKIATSIHSKNRNTKFFILSYHFISIIILINSN